MLQRKARIKRNGLGRINVHIHNAKPEEFIHFDDEKDRGAVLQIHHRLTPCQCSVDKVVTVLALVNEWMNLYEFNFGPNLTYSELEIGSLKHASLCWPSGGVMMILMTLMILG